MKGFLKMKSKLISLMASVMACGVMAQDANLMKYVSLLPANLSTNLAVTGATIDYASYKGNACLVVQTGTASATNNLLTLTLQHSPNSNFSPASTVTNTAGVACVVTVPVVDATSESLKVTTLSIDSARLKKYVRVIFTTTLADHYIPVSAMLVAPMKAE
jgi:hypothetical protein